MNRMIIRIGGGDDGRYFVSRTFERAVISVDPPGMLFKVKQEEGEKMEDFEARVRAKADEHGITVEGL
jgi:hypothetical protein